MPGLLKLNLKEAKDLADEIERQGGNTDGLRAAINDAGNPNGNTLVPAGTPSDEEHILWLRSQSAIEEGEDLECLVCHEKFDRLVSGTCEVCFREWALTVKRQSVMKELL